MVWVVLDEEDIMWAAYIALWTFGACFTRPLGVSLTGSGGASPPVLNLLRRFPSLLYNPRLRFSVVLQSKVVGVGSLFLSEPRRGTEMGEGQERWRERWTYGYVQGISLEPYQVGWAGEVSGARPP